MKDSSQRSRLHARVAQLNADGIKAAFRAFLLQVDDHWQQLPNKDNSGQLGAAYRAFWEVYGQVG